MENVNILSIILATLIPSAIGILWFGIIFKNPWMKNMNITEEKLKSSITVPNIIISIIASLIFSFFLLNFNNETGQEGAFDTFAHGVWHGVFLVVFLISPVLLIQKLIGQSSWANLLMSIGYWVITFGLMGGILDAMNHWG